MRADTNVAEGMKDVPNKRYLYTKMSGVISTLSLGFRGVKKIRESIHSVFLHHAIVESGMDVGIVNAYEMIGYFELKDDILHLCKDLVFNKSEDDTNKC